MEAEIDDRHANADDGSTIAIGGRSREDGLHAVWVDRPRWL